MNHKAVGEISEAVVLAELVKRGKTVLLPFGDNQRYDLVVDESGTFIRVQVKTAWYDDGALVFCTRSQNPFTGRKSYYDGQADVFAVYSSRTERVYWVPVAGVPRSVMRLRLDPARNNQQLRIAWAKDYESWCGAVSPLSYKQWEG